MKKLAQTNDAVRHTVNVVLDETVKSAKGFETMDVEQGWDGNWYETGFIPPEPATMYALKRKNEYPPVGDMIDAICKFIQGDKTEIETLLARRASIKQKYPKV